MANYDYLKLFFIIFSSYYVFTYSTLSNGQKPTSIIRRKIEDKISEEKIQQYDEGQQPTRLDDEGLKKFEGRYKRSPHVSDGNNELYKNFDDELYGNNLLIDFDDFRLSSTHETDIDNFLFNVYMKLYENEKFNELQNYERQLSKRVRQFRPRFGRSVGIHPMILDNDLDNLFLRRDYIKINNEENYPLIYFHGPHILKKLVQFKPRLGKRE